MAWCKMNADRLLAMCMKETTMGETLNGKPGRWVRATKELRAAMLTGDMLRLSREQTPFSVSTPDWRGWDALDYDVWVPDSVRTVLDRVKNFEKLSPGIFKRNVGRTTAAVYRACERVAAGESLVYVVGNEHEAGRVTEMARQFLTEEFKAKFYYRQGFGDFVVTYQATPDGTWNMWGPKERIAALAVRVCATVKEYEDLRYGRGEVAFANDYGEWASERLRASAGVAERLIEHGLALKARIKSVEAQYDTQEKEALAFKIQVGDLKEKLQASEKQAKDALGDRNVAVEELTTLRRRLRAIGLGNDVSYATYARVPVAKDQSSIGVRAACDTTHSACSCDGC